MWWRLRDNIDTNSFINFATTYINIMLIITGWYAIYKSEIKNIKCNKCKSNSILDYYWSCRNFPTSSPASPDILTGSRPPFISVICLDGCRRGWFCMLAQQVNEEGTVWISYTFYFHYSIQKITVTRTGGDGRLKYHWQKHKRKLLTLFFFVLFLLLEASRTRILDHNFSI